MSICKYHFNQLKLIYILDYKTMGREQILKKSFINEAFIPTLYYFKSSFFLVTKTSEFSVSFIILLVLNKDVGT